MTDAAMDFVVFSDDWGRHPSSCQHLFARLMGRHRVLWVNTIGMRAPKVDGFTFGRGLEKLRQWSRPLRQIAPNLHVYAPAMLPATEGRTGRFNARWVARRIRRVMARLRFERPVLLTTVPTAADYLGRLGERASVYYITDDYRSWPGANPDVIAAQDATLTATCDLVLPCGDALAAERHAWGGMEMLPHAVDLDHFARGGDTEEPADLARIPHPRLCFFGLIYEKIDIDLFARIAREQPDKHIVLMGPVKTDLSAVEPLPNVHVLGPKPYADLPAYLHATDVLLLAYRLDEQTSRNAPLKIRECLAAGKPVVAKGMRDLQQYADLIHVVDTDDAYLAVVDRACRETPVAPETMRAAVAGDSWEARAQQVERALEPIIRETPRVRRQQLVVAPAAGADAWDAYVASRADGCVWHRRGWTQAMDAAYKMGDHSVMARRGDRVTGVLPLALQASRVFGRHLVSLPWLDHAGILADDDASRAALGTEAMRLARRLGADLTLRDTADAGTVSGIPATSSVQTDKVVMTLAVATDPDTLWTGLKAKVRNQVRKARKAGLTAHWVDTDRLSDFHKVYATNMRDLGSPPHSERFFADVFDRFADVARLLLVRRGRNAVAGAIVLADSPAWQIPWASSLRRANSMCPSHLMYWTILAAACGETDQFCFGRSSRDSGTYRFKAQWGAMECPLVWRTWGGAAGDGEPGRVVGLVQRAWQHVPVPVARTLGPHIIRCVG